MILELYMKNCCFSRRKAEFNLGENLNILTGETGSGNLL